MKIINGVLIALLIVMRLSIISVQGEDIETVTLYSDFQNEEQLMKQVNDMLQNNPYAHVQVLDEAYKDNIILPKEGSCPSNMHGYTICAVMCAVPFRQARDDILSLYRAEAGITVSVSKVKEISNTYDQLYGADSTLLSRALGFSPTVTRQITMIGSYAIPSDGRQRELRIRPVDEVYYYSVYQGKKCKGIGSARRVIGVEFSVIQSDLE